MTYWLGIDSTAVWEAVKLKHDVNGTHPYAFPVGRRKSVEKIKAGDRIINYMKGAQRFFAVWEVTGEHFVDPQIYASQTFSECVEVKPLVLIEPEAGVQFNEIKDHLNKYQKLQNKNNWGRMIQTATVWNDDDGETILGALGYDMVADELASDLQDIQRRRIEPTVRKQLIDARLGQGRFRLKVLANWDYRCAVTGSTITEVIQASHLKPWKYSNDEERLDPDNGVTLLATLHVLFDRYFITFSTDGNLEFSSMLTNKGRDELHRLGLSGDRGLIKPLTAKQREYLALHRTEFVRRAERAEASNG